MSDIVHTTVNPYTQIYEVKVSLKNGEWLNGYCRGIPNACTFADWIRLTIEMPYKGVVVVKTEEIVYILYRPRREKE